MRARVRVGRRGEGARVRMGVRVRVRVRTRVRLRVTVQVRMRVTVRDEGSLGLDTVCVVADWQVAGTDSLV